MPPAYLEHDTAYSLLQVATKQGAAAQPNLKAVPMRDAEFPLASLVAATTMDEDQARAVKVRRHNAGVQCLSSSCSCANTLNLLSTWTFGGHTKAVLRTCFGSQSSLPY